MPIVLDPTALSATALNELRASLREALGETQGLVDAPGAPVVDPGSLVTARDLLQSTVALLDRPGARDPRSLADEANLAYAVLVATIDLVKSHTGLPRVPRPRSATPAAEEAAPPVTRPRRSSRAG